MERIEQLQFAAGESAGEVALSIGLSLVEAYQGVRDIEYDETCETIADDAKAYAYVNSFLPEGEIPIPFRNAFWRTLYRETLRNSN